jgi:hypothetical protein
MIQDRRGCSSGPEPSAKVGSGVFCTDAQPGAGGLCPCPRQPASRARRPLGHLSRGRLRAHRPAGGGTGFSGLSPAATHLPPLRGGPLWPVHLAVLPDLLGAFRATSWPMVGRNAGGDALCVRPLSAWVPETGPCGVEDECHVVFFVRRRRHFAIPRPRVRPPIKRMLLGSGEGATPGASGDSGPEGPLVGPWGPPPELVPECSAPGWEGYN